jgi:hypothetical protein
MDLTSRADLDPPNDAVLRSSEQSLYYSGKV